MFFLPENGERGRNLLRGREALPAQPEKGTVEKTDKIVR